MRYKFWGVRGSVPTSLSSDKLMSKIQSILQQISVSDSQDECTFGWRKYRCDPSVPAQSQDPRRFQSDEPQNCDAVYEV